MAENMTEPGIGHAHKISIRINGIEHRTSDHKQTVAQVLALGGFTVEDYTLVSKDEPSVPLPPEEILHLKDGDEFLALRKTNPVSEIGGMQDLERFFVEELGRRVEYLKGANGDNLIIHDVEIPAGPLAGKVCDIGIQCTDSRPFALFPAFHTRPQLVSMGQENATHPGKIAPEWQYWSRQWQKPPLSPGEVWAWVLTALTKAKI